MLAPIAWRTPPRHYGPWERIVSLITEGLVERGIDVTLFATADSITRAGLQATCPCGYEENPDIDPKVWESLHIAEVFERAADFDLIHNHFDFLPLTYSRLVTTPVVTTIHGFSSPRILPVYEKYNDSSYYVSISNADRAAELDYIATVYHGIDIENFDLNERPEPYLLFYGRIHPDKGTVEAIAIAEKVQRPLIIAGIIQDHAYYKKAVESKLRAPDITYIGSVGPEGRNKLLGNAAALLHPINFEEPFGLSVIEAMACGTPVIAFNRGSMPEIIQSGVDGFLVTNVAEAAEAVHRLDTINRRRCRQTVRQRFSRDIMVDHYIEVYEKILSDQQTEKYHDRC